MGILFERTDITLDKILPRVGLSLPPLAALYNATLYKQSEMIMGKLLLVILFLGHCYFGVQEGGRFSIDGCNTCSCENDKPRSCTEMHCPSGCQPGMVYWLDPCNSCVCPNVCTMMLCHDTWES